MFAPQTLPRQQARFLCIEIPQKNFFVVLIQGRHISLPHPLFPVYRFFFPVAVIASFGVRVYVSIVAGGSLTNNIVTQSRPKRTGFLPNFLMSEIGMRFQIGNPGENQEHPACKHLHGSSSVPLAVFCCAGRSQVVKTFFTEKLGLKPRP